VEIIHLLLDCIIKEINKEWRYKESATSENSGTQVETLLWLPSCTCTACIYEIDMGWTLSHCTGGIWSLVHTHQTGLRCPGVSVLYQRGMGIAVL